MNCSEVMELIQRQLDDDLDQSEHGLLTEHMRSCSACAEMFERLTMLNDDLEQLPKVLPKFSLVDAIMPQLDEIDRLNASKLSTDKENQQESRTTDASGTQTLIVDNKQMERKQAVPQEQVPLTKARWMDRFNWRTASAVVAAGLVFGLFMVNYEGAKTQESADFSELTANQQTETANVAEKLDTRAFSENKSVQSDQLPSKTSAHDNREANEPEGVSTEPKTSPDKGQQDNSDPAAPAILKQQPSGGAEEKLDPTRKSESTDDSTPIQSPAEADVPIGQQPAEADMKMPPGAVPPLPDEKLSAMRSSFAAEPQELEVVSPDQQYAVIWKDEAMTLVSLQNAERTSIQSIDWKHQVTDMKWSEDGKQLIIAYVNDTGEQASATLIVGSKGMELQTKLEVADSKK